MAKTLFEFFLWSNPKSSALSEEQVFFDENASLFNEPLSRYNDPTSLYSLIRANILLLSLKNKETLFHYISRLSVENLHEEKTREALFKNLPSFRFKGATILVPTYSPQVNEKLLKTPWVFKSFPYDAMVKDRNVSLSHPFDVYGNLPYSSPFTRLVRLDVRKNNKAIFYHPEFTTLFVIDEQGLLENEIPLKDEKVKNWPPRNLFEKLDKVMEDYFRLDRTAFLEDLLSFGLISKDFHDEALENLNGRLEKKKRRLGK